MIEDSETKAYYKVTKGTGNEKELEYVVNTAKTATITIPDTITFKNITYKVTAIAGSALKDNKNIKSVTIGKNVRRIGDKTFKGCTNLTKVVMGNNVTSIGDYAFYKCPKLTSVKMSTKINSIGKYAFYKCTKDPRQNLKSNQK